MKNGNFYNFQVPELGDRPDITQVSNALLAVEGITASSIEYITATVSGSTLVCNTNISDYEYNRLKYVEDKVFYLVWDKNVLEHTAINSISIDGLSVVNLNINTNINNGDVAYFVYDGSLFNCTVMNLEGKLDKGILPPNVTTAEDIFKMQVSNAGLQYDEDNLYINNDLLKKKNHYYIDTEQIGLWKCLQDTNVNYNSSTYFSNRSNEENSRKLENLSVSKIIFNNGKFIVRENEFSYTFEAVGEISIGSFEQVALQLNITSPLRIRIASKSSAGGVIENETVSMVISSSGFSLSLNSGETKRWLVQGFCQVVKF